MKRMDKTELSAVRLRWQRFWHYARPIATWLMSIGLVAVIAIVTVRFVLSHYISAVDPDDATPYEIVIPQSASAGRIADLLYHACGEGEKGPIVSSASFKIYVDFVGKATSLKAAKAARPTNLKAAQVPRPTSRQGNPQATAPNKARPLPRFPRQAQPPRRARKPNRPKLRRHQTPLKPSRPIRAMGNSHGQEDRAVHRRAVMPEPGACRS